MKKIVALLLSLVIVTSVPANAMDGLSVVNKSQLQDLDFSCINIFIAQRKRWRLIREVAHTMKRNILMVP